MKNNNEEKYFRVAGYDYNNGSITAIIHVPPYEGAECEFFIDMLNAKDIWDYAEKNSLNYGNDENSRTGEPLFLIRKEELFLDEENKDRAQEVIYEYLKERLFDPIYNERLFKNKFAYRD